MRETMTEEISKIQTRKYIWTIVVYVVYVILNISTQILKLFLLNFFDILHISKAIIVNGIFNALRLELKGNKI